MNEKKEILITFILAILATVLSGIPFSCRSGWPCIYYWDLNVKWGLDPNFSDCAKPLRFFDEVKDTFWEESLVFVNSKYLINGFFLIDFFFWFCVILAIWQVVKWIKGKYGKGN